MSTPRWPGRHELGQNFLRDRRVVRSIVELAEDGPGPIVEWAGGAGALTIPLSRLGRPMEVVELDPRRVRQLRSATPRHVRVVEGDLLRHAPPRGGWTLVANLPFHLTTPALRRLLSLPGWDRAILVTQWEVARKRAAVGGTTQLTAEWWPWFDFTLRQRIPARAFHPRPSVDAGLLLVERRAEPLLDDSEQPDYRAFVRRVFSGRGRTLPQVLSMAGGLSTQSARRWCRRVGLDEHALPRSLEAGHWVGAYRLTRPDVSGSPADRAGTSARRRPRNRRSRRGARPPR